MNVSDVARRVREAAGDTAVLQFTNSTLTDWINDGVRECIIENSLLQARASQNLVVGTSDYTLPTDIFKLHSVTVDGFKLEVLTLEQWQERNAGEFSIPTPSGSPFVCYVYAGVLTIWPKPDKVLPLVINYSKLPTSTVYTEPAGVPTWTPNTFSIPEQYHNRIVTYCLAQVALQDDLYDKYQALMDQFKTGVIALDHAAKTEEDLYPFISVSSRDQGDMAYYDNYLP